MVAAPGRSTKRLAYQRRWPHLRDRPTIIVSEGPIAPHTPSASGNWSDGNVENRDPSEPLPGFKELAPRLYAELETYLTSCQDKFDPDTHWSVKKRPITCQQIWSTISRLAGYAVYIKEMPAETLGLRQLADPAFLTGFAYWWLRRRQRNTAGVRVFLHTMSTISTHVLHDDTLVKAIHGIFDQLGPEESDE